MAKQRSKRTNYELKRTLVKAVFNGETEDGEPMGVYLQLPKSEECKPRNKRWEFFIRGHLTNIAGSTDWTDAEMGEFFAEGGGVLRETLP